MSADPPSRVVNDDIVRAMARAAGIAIPPEDVAPLVAGMQRHAERMEALQALDLAGYDPVVAFDPRWL